MFGPVITSPADPLHIGAAILSNNTAELSAIAEAMLYVLDHPLNTQTIRICYDSKYAANTIRGRWSPKTNRHLIRVSQHLLQQLKRQYTVQWHWIKGHTQNWGNSQADELANKGRSTNSILGRWSLRTRYDHHLFLPIKLRERPVPIQSEQIGEQIKQAAISTFPTVPPTTRKKWVTANTLHLIQEQQQLRGADRLNMSDVMQKRIASSARKDKKKWLEDAFQEGAQGTARDQWAPVKTTRKGYCAKHIKLKWKGKVWPEHLRAQVLAEQLAEQQWKDNETADQKQHLASLPPIRPPSPDLPVTPFTEDELQHALSELKKNKAPGPDDVTNEELKLLDYENQRTILAHVNHCWATGAIPDSWKHATVVNIFKGSGSTEDPTRYRPIALLSVQYKLLARMMQHRISKHMDQHIDNTQYGFRKSKSTSDPIHILRRVQEMFEATHQPLHLLFLDWTMAFDKLSHTGLHSALVRFGLPDMYTRLISDIYTDPTFEVRDNNTHTGKYPQGSGIRQGCPLSPYLFIIFLTVLMHDVKQELTR